MDVSDESVGRARDPDIEDRGSGLHQVRVPTRNVVERRPPEHQLELREPEDERVLFVDEHDVDGIAPGSDVIQGIVSREMAARCYGVVFDETTATADHDASATQRASMAADGRPRDEDGLTADGIRARDAAARAEAERSQARHAASHHHHGRHRHRHAQVRPEDDYELRLQLALARRCC